MYKATIGLEIHIELKTKSKMFCSCANDPDEQEPNALICPICLGHPGTLPVINEEAIRKVIKTGLALNSQILERSKFDRKNYFYPDLPKGYQISQYDAPLCQGGYLEMVADNNSKLKKIRITRIHLEEDTGKLIHPQGKNYSLVDFNRAGIPLMELVTEPDIASAKEAKNFAQELQMILRYLNVSNAEMEKGQMRVEVNISILPQDSKPGAKKPKLGTKVEIKNLNSFRSVEKAVDYEIKRQSKVLSSGKKIIQETRGWDDIKGVTFSQREKEEAHDYRYFSEPDLPPLYFSQEFIQKIESEIPELPEQRRLRFKKEYSLLGEEIEVFVYNKEFGQYFEKVVSEFEPNLDREKLFKLIKLAANYLITDLRGLLKGRPVSGESFLIDPENFAEFIALIYDGKISSKIAKMVLLEMFKTGADPSNIIQEKGLAQITDKTEIEKIIEEAIKNNPKAKEDYKKGKEEALQFLIGQIMAKSKGKASPELANKLLREILAKQQS